MRNIQQIPQAILGGVDLGKLSREQLKAHVIGLRPSPVEHAQVQIAFQIDGARKRVEAQLQPLVFASENEESLWREGLRDEGLSDEQIDLIAAGQPVPGLGREWQPIALLEAEGRW